MAQGEAVRAAYDAVAGIYDQFTGNNNYELWFGELLPKLEELGLRKGALLDVACGTGKGIGPMLDRGWTVTACDISPGMIEQAKEKFPEGVKFEVHDMSELPHLGDFDLVWALNDPVNYLVDDGDLERAFAAMGANLAPEGLLVFDCNTMKIFREAFGADVEDKRGDTGHGAASVEPTTSTGPRSPATGSRPASTTSATGRSMSSRPRSPPPASSRSPRSANARRAPASSSAPIGTRTATTRSSTSRSAPARRGRGRRGCDRPLRPFAQFFVDAPAVRVASRASRGGPGRL